MIPVIASANAATAPASGGIFAAIPSPETSSWYIGSLAIHAYGIIIVAAMVLAACVAYIRYGRRGGASDLVYEIALWAIPLGLVGGRLWHVFTHPSDYFGEGKNPLTVLYIWQGGMAIFGAVLFGALGAYIAIRRNGQRLGPFADALAPGLMLAQALGRWGNYFNQELFGSATSLPWGLEISDLHLPAGYESGTLFHPTFLYECLWNVIFACLLMWIDRKIKFKAGQVFALYLVFYGLVRFLLEFLRLDVSGQFLGLRTNQWAALACLLLGLVAFVVLGKLGRSTRVSLSDCAEYYRRHPKLEAPLEIQAYLAEQKMAEEASPQDDDGTGDSVHADSRMNPLNLRSETKLREDD